MSLIGSKTRSTVPARNEYSTGWIHRPYDDSWYMSESWYQAQVWHPSRDGGGWNVRVDVMTSQAIYDTHRIQERFGRTLHADTLPEAKALAERRMTGQGS